MSARTRPKPEFVGEHSVDRLLLDPLNHRLPSELRGANQQELLGYFIEAYNLEEIATSIADNGFFDEEPLLTIDPAEDAAREYLPDGEGLLLVIEGNRRLATLLVLNGKAPELVRGGLSQAIDAVRENEWLVTEAPVRQYTSRQDLRDYLGFRHVSGLMQWEAEAKARYVYDLVTTQNMTFAEVARTIGSRSDAIRRQYRAWSALQQARSSGTQVDVEPFIDRFGVFYRSLQNPGIRNFVHLDGWLDQGPELTEPLREDGVERLGELGGFMFGPQRVLKESRQLDALGSVLASDTALAVLRAERDLELALQELPTERDQVFASLRVAYRQLVKAGGAAFQFAGDSELLREVVRLEQMVSRLSDDLTVPLGEGRT